MSKVDLVIDLQYGSTGKGLIAGFLAEKRGHDVVINANMPNAGHTYVNAEGRTWMHKVLPNGIVSPNLEYIMIGPGSVFDVDRLMFELDQSSDLIGRTGVEVRIHPQAVVLNEGHVQLESQLVGKIGSTAQGSMAALVEKMRRDPDHNPTAGNILPDFGLGHMVATHEEWLDILEGATSILAEGAQGFSLGLHQQFYPFCTSRECTPARFMSDMGIPLHMLGEVIGTARTYPIRVGGNSGECYDDQVEIQWEDIGVEAEKTTVTQRTRRVFTFSERQMRDAIRNCRPDYIFLNFCNYCPDGGDEVETIINRVWNECLGFNGYKGVIWKGYGPSFNDIEILVPF